MNLHQPSFAQDAIDWKYHLAYGGGGEWFVRDYKAKVKRDGSRITIEAYNKAGTLMESIHGSVKGSQLEAVRRVRFSEPGDEPLKGSFSIYLDGSKKYETYMLYNEVTFVGVTTSN